MSEHERIIFIAGQPIYKEPDPEPVPRDPAEVRKVVILVLVIVAAVASVFADYFLLSHGGR